MSRKLLGLSVTGTLLAGAVAADAPRVAVDIAPVHSLVSRVMDGVGIPDLIIAPGGSPHEYSLRPSEAGALQDADLVFWVGADLTPWLHDAIENLAGDADTTELLELEGSNGDLPIIFLTKDTAKHLDTLGSELGAYLQKPVCEEKLLSTVQSLLRLPASS